jgi:hypothetical protein
MRLEMQIYLLQNGQQTGPFTAEQVRDKVFSCEISENDLGWHESLAGWQPLNTILSFNAPLPAPKPLPPLPVQSNPPPFTSSPVACPTCGNPKWRASDPCQVCATALAAATSRIVQQAPPEKKKVNKAGAWCPHCGNRNSYKTESGAGCLILGILFISLIGILLIPFLPKSWTCRECGHKWK